MSHKPWTETEQFRHVVKFIKHKPREEYPNNEYPELLFRGTVKLHGSNLSIRRDGGNFIAQSRKQSLSLENDCYGFARLLDETLQDAEFAAQLHALFDRFTTNPEDVVTLYGEFVGPGIQSRVGVTELPRKMWFIFGVKVNDDYVESTTDIDIESCDWMTNILQYPVFFQGVNFNGDSEYFANLTEQFQKITLAIEDCCPVAKAFGIEGIGEGIVWTCVEHPTVSRLMFKTKGEKHSGKGETNRKVATIAPEKLQKITDVVEYVLPEGRLQQGLEHVPELEITHMGTYIKWVSQDVQKEELDTILSNDLEWNDVKKRVSKKACAFFKQQVDDNTFKD